MWREFFHTLPVKTSKAFFMNHMSFMYQLQQQLEQLTRRTFPHWWKNCGTALSCYYDLWCFRYSVDTHTENICIIIIDTIKHLYFAGHMFRKNYFTAMWFVYLCNSYIQYTKWCSTSTLRKLLVHSQIQMVLSRVDRMPLQAISSGEMSGLFHQGTCRAEKEDHKYNLRLIC